MHLLWRGLRTSPSGTQTVSRKRKISMETESTDGTSDSEHGLVQGVECKLEVDETRERHAAGGRSRFAPGGA